MNIIYRNLNVNIHEPITLEQRKNTYTIIRHKNPKGKDTWWRAIFHDEQGRAHKSPTYHGQASWARRSAQNWLYANIHCWCNIAVVEQRIIDENGNSKHIVLRTEEII